MTPWLLVDYGEVISRAYDPVAHAEIADLLDLEPGRLTEAYWRHRPGYDGGQPSDDYWALVAGRDLTAAEVERLDAVDLRGWGRLDTEVLGLLHELRADGVRLALLSNAPRNQADAFEAAQWARDFEHLFVSSRLGVVKPSLGIFEQVLATMDAAPEDVTFVDDRPDNVAAAEALGIRGIVFTGVDALRAAIRTGTVA